MMQIAVLMDKFIYYLIEKYVMLIKFNYKEIVDKPENLINI